MSKNRSRGFDEWVGFQFVRQLRWLFHLRELNKMVMISDGAV
jgi:hypothetical protein